MFGAKKRHWELAMVLIYSGSHQRQEYASLSVSIYSVSIVRAMARRRASLDAEFNRFVSKTALYDLLQCMGEKVPMLNISKSSCMGSKATCLV